MEQILLSNLTYKHSVNKLTHPHLHIFNIYAENKMQKIGTFVCHKSGIPLRPGYKGSVLAIDYLEVTETDKGAGSTILKFAHEYSQKIGCKGYMTLKADGSFTPKKIPHLFYRKFGFSSFDPKTDKKLDTFIHQNKNATSVDFPSLLMHYPPQDKTESRKFVLKNLLKKTGYFKNFSVIIPFFRLAEFLKPLN